MGRRGPRKTYSLEFKREAVKMCQNRSVMEVSEALGVHNSSLYDWEKELAGEKALSEQAGTGGASRKELEEENKRLKRENENLREEAEILKKASAYFAKYLR